MGFSIGSIVSDVAKAVTDPGKLVTDVVNSVLPQNMKAIGDIAGGLVDLETGHPLQALGHLTDTLKDLPQLAQGQTGPATGSAAPAGTQGAEPEPPPARSPSANAKPTLATVIKNGTSAAKTAGQVGSGAAVSLRASGSSNDAVSLSFNLGGRTVTVSERTAGGNTSLEVSYRAPTARPTISFRAPTDQPAAPRAATGGATAAASAPAGAASAAAGGTGAATAGASGAASKTAAAGATAAGSTGSSTEVGGSSGTKSSTDATASTDGSSSATPTDLKSLMALSPDQFMQAVTSGKIPPDVANSQSAMMQVQAKMNQITQMNQLVTSMMSAMHQMEMSIIQNIRA